MIGRKVPIPIPIFLWKFEVQPKTHIQKSQFWIEGWVEKCYVPIWISLLKITGVYVK